MLLEIDSRDAEQTVRLGAALGALLRAGDVIGISGDLGAGKTQLVRGLARGLDIDPELIYSPSFTLVAEHEGRLRLNHIDLFRLGLLYLLHVLAGLVFVITSPFFLPKLPRAVAGKNPFADSTESQPKTPGRREPNPFSRSDNP